MPRAAHPVCRLAVFACLAAFAGPVSMAQEAPPPASDAKTREPGQEPALKLSLQSSIFYALANNPTLRAAGIDISIARTGISQAESAFDPAFHSSFNRVDFENPTANILETGTGAVSQKSAIAGTKDSFDMGLRDRLQTGASLDLTYSQVRNYTSAANVFLNPSWSSSIALTATQPLLRGGWLPFNQSQIHISQNTAEISRWKFYETVSTVVLRVVEAYWLLVFLIEDVEVKKQSLDLAKEQLEINRVKVQQGVLAPLELKQNETSVYGRTADLINAEKAVRDGEDVLRRLIFPLDLTERWDVRLEPADRPKVDESFKAPDWKAAAREALEHRPEILQAKIDLENRGITIRAAESEALPQLDLTGSYGVNALTGKGQTIYPQSGPPVQVPINGDWQDNLSDLFNPQFRTWTVGLALDIPIGNREAKSNLLRAKYQRRQALILYSDLQNSVVQDVRASIRSIETSAKTVDFTLKARESAEEQLRAGRSKFDVGLATNFEVLQLQDDLAQKKRDVNRAYTDYEVARARLQRAQGNLVDYKALGIDIHVDESDQ